MMRFLYRFRFIIPVIIVLLIVFFIIHLFTANELKSIKFTNNMSAIDILPDQSIKLTVLTVPKNYKGTIELQTSNDKVVRVSDNLTIIGAIDGIYDESAMVTAYSNTKKGVISASIPVNLVPNMYSPYKAQFDRDSYKMGVNNTMKIYYKTIPANVESNAIAVRLNQSQNFVIDKYTMPDSNSVGYITIRSLADSGKDSIIIRDMAQNRDIGEVGLESIIGYFDEPEINISVVKDSSSNSTKNISVSYKIDVDVASNGFDNTNTFWTYDANLISINYASNRFGQYIANCIGKDVFDATFTINDNYKTSKTIKIDCR